MLLASTIAMVIAVVITSEADNLRLSRALNSPAFEASMSRELARSQPLLTEAQHSPALCATVAHDLLSRVLAETLPNVQGPNRAARILEADRASISYQGPAGNTCQYPRSGITAWNARADALANASEGWSMIKTLHPDENPGTTLTIAVAFLAPFAALAHDKDVSWSVIGLYILAINFLSVLALVPLLVRRIERAERAATAWTQGKLSTRINDLRADEFGRLTERFDHMADVLSGVIEVKQALAASDERNRLARDLHDTAKQRAFALGLQLSALKRLESPGTANANAANKVSVINAALSLITHLQQDLADVIKRLSAPTIAEIGLRRALTDGIDALLAGSGTSWSLNLNHEDEQALQQSPEIARQLLLIAIEATANVLKHACATHVDVGMQRSGTRHAWRIVDNGKGFDPHDASSPGMGLANMRLRAKALDDGEFEISSAPGEGTTIGISYRINQSASL